MIPIDSATLEENALMCGCKDRFGWIKTPKNLVFSTIFILLS